MKAILKSVSTAIPTMALLSGIVLIYGVSKEATAGILVGIWFWHHLLSSLTKSEAQPATPVQVEVLRRDMNTAGQQLTSLIQTARQEAAQAVSELAESTRINSETIKSIIEKVNRQRGLP